jgi:hypothetical protein
MGVLSMFASFYKNRSREDLMALVRSQFVVTAELDVMTLDAKDPNKRVRGSITWLVCIKNVAVYALDVQATHAVYVLI